MIIRTEQPEDYTRVYELVREAFETAEISAGTEQDLVVALRKGDAFIPKLSLVAIIDEKIVGHIMFTKIKIGEQDALSLAPLAVDPAFQKQGIGSRLIIKGHQIAKDLGYQHIVLVGSEKYYPKFGYLPASDFGIIASFDIPPQNFMAIDLTWQNEKIEGVIKYSKEFGI